jgi:glucose 1-dehydrogenase
MLLGRTIVITGGTRGFGRAMAEACLREGAQVMISGRASGTVAAAVLEMGAASPGAIAGTAGDVADLGQVWELAKATQTRFGRIDVWINNAGVTPPYGPSAYIAPEEFLPTITTNIQGTYHGTLVAMRYFLEHPERPVRPKIITITGRGDRGGPVPLQNGYASSKAWVRNFTLAFAREHADCGVDVLAFNPGMMSTDFLTCVETVSGYEHRLRALTTVIRMWARPPEEPARIAAHLCSAATDGHNGTEIHPYGVLSLLGGALREGLRRVSRRPAPGRSARIISVPRWPGF